MMPFCYYSWGIWRLRWHCNRPSDMVEVVAGEQYAACNKHQHWFLKTIANADLEEFHRG